MHHIFKADGGWVQEILRDDSDQRGLPEESSLAGVVYIGYTKQTDSYFANLRFEEHLHNKRVSVEAVVYRNENGRKGSNGKGNGHHKTLADALFSQGKEFTGTACKQDAAEYARSLKEKIEWLYFPLKQ